MRVKDLKENDVYWFFNTTVPSKLPQKVKLLEIDRQVCLFDSYIQNEKFAHSIVIASSLFRTEDEATLELSKIISDGMLHFVPEKDIQILKTKHPECWL
jgi:hypothetical protein